MTIGEARKLFIKPVFGNEDHIAIRDMLEVAGQLKEARNNCEAVEGVSIDDVIPVDDLTADEAEAELEYLQSAGYL